MLEKPVIGMQVHFVGELIDEGIEKSLDTMQQIGGINTIFMLVNMDRMDSNFWGKLTHNPNPKRKNLSISGFFYEPHTKYYAKTKIKPVKTKDPTLHGIDIIQKTLEAAKRRDMKFYVMILHHFPFSENEQDCFIVDIQGRRIPGVFCINNPNVRDLYYGMVEDLLRNYDLDGIFLGLLDHCVQFGFRTLTDEMVELAKKKELDHPEMGLTCFCQHCVQLAKKKGIDIEIIKKGLQRAVSQHLIPEKVEKLTTTGDAMQFLLRVSEYFQWLTFRAQCCSDVHHEIYELAKSIKPDVQVALDIHGPDDSWKFGSDFHSLSQFSDWVKPMFYSGTYPAPPSSPEEVYEETKKALRETDGKTDIVAGVDAVSQSSNRIKQSVTQAIKAGSRGIIVSWDYALICLENMKAAKVALRESQNSA